MMRDSHLPVMPDGAVQDLHEIRSRPALSSKFAALPETKSAQKRRIFVLTCMAYRLLKGAWHPAVQDSAEVYHLPIAATGQSRGHRQLPWLKANEF